MKTPKKRTREENTKSIANSSISISAKSYENDLNTYLAQYLTKDNNAEMVNNKYEVDKQQRSVLQETDLNNQNKQQQTLNSDSNNSSLQLINAEKAAAQKQLFSNKFFTVIGFEVDEVEEIKAVIESVGGQVNEFDEDETLNTKSVYLSKHADYFLLPMTISEPLCFGSLVTIYWLRKCIEQKILYSLNEHVLFQPVPRFNTDRPLTGCVITISGFLNGYEKDTLTSLCQLVGAVTQTSFSSKRSANIYPNTHLLCKSAEGPKYTASKQWKIPAVSVEWLIDSCVSGVKADEKKYLIESDNKYEDFIQNLDIIRRNINDNQTVTAATSMIEYNKSTTIVQQDDGGSPVKGSENDDFESPKSIYKGNDSSLLNDSVSKKPRLDVDNSHSLAPDMISKMTIHENVLKAPQTDSVFKTPQTIDIHAKRTGVIQSKTPVNKSQECGLSTPPCNPRLQHLKQTDLQTTTGPNNGTPQNSSLNYGNEPNWQTPLWLKSPNDPKVKNFECRLNVNVNVDEVMYLLRSPDPAGGPPLTPLHEVVIRSFKQANANAKIPGFYDYSSDSPVVLYDFEKKKKQEEADQEQINGINSEMANQNKFYDDEDDIPSATPLEVKEMKEILKNVKVYVSKKLAKSQAELNSLVESLGGDFIWIYNNSCTHVVYNGKLNDNNKELRVAKEQNKIIVSPHWLYACQEYKQRVDESQYPCTYNPSKCAVVTSRTPKVSLNEKQQQQPHGMSTPVSVQKVMQKDLLAKSSQQPPRSQLRKTTTENIIKNYCSDDDDENEEENEMISEANSKLLKKKQNSRLTSSSCVPQLTVPDVEENDSEMNLIDSQFIRNCENQYRNVENPSAAAAAVDIPDSIDIKNEFLNQLQDKLANIRTTSNNSATFNSPTIIANNLNSSQSSMLNEHQIMNELNKSGRSKWGHSLIHELDDNSESTNRIKSNEDEDLLCVRILANNEDGIDLEKLKQINMNKKRIINNNNSSKHDISKKIRQFSKVSNDDDDDEDLHSRHNNVEPSQIQMTLWKDEQHQNIKRNGKK